MKYHSLHFIGSGGIGMSALAQFFSWKGCKVTGSDRGAADPANRRIFDSLAAWDIKTYPQDGSFAADGEPDAIVFSTAIEEDNPDLAAAGKAARLHRSAALKLAIEASAPAPTVAITGSCGKSSVTGLIAETLYHLGMDPAMLDGALVNAFADRKCAGNFRPGTGPLVLEADESDKSLLGYSPDYAVILNIGCDHYSGEELERVFGAFASNARRGVLVPKALEGKLLKGVAAGVRTDVFDASEVQVIRNAQGKPCALFADGKSCLLPAASFHCALNALAARKLLLMLGCPDEDILENLGKFSGVWRRNDFAGTLSGGAQVYDDYAHNPEKISAAVATAKAAVPDGSGKVILCFQPHGYGPFGFMKDELFEQLSSTLDSNDTVILFEPFYAGGTSSFKPTAEEVIAEWRQRSPEFKLMHGTSRQETAEYLKNLAPGGDTVVLIAGARDNSLSDWAKSLCTK